MKLLKVKSRKYKDKQYFKYRVNISEQDIKNADMKEGDDLEVKSEKGKIILKKKSI